MGFLLMHSVSTVDVHRVFLTQGAEGCWGGEMLYKYQVRPFLLLQQTAVQSSILILSRAVDRILQTYSVVKNSAATIQTDMAVSDSDA